MSDYGSIESYITQIKKAAIEAYMIVDCGFDSGSVDGGSFEGTPSWVLVNDAPPGGWRVSYPSGEMTYVYTGDPYPDPFEWNFKANWDTIDVLVESCVNRLREIPEGTALGDVVKVLSKVATTLAVGGTTVDGEGNETKLKYTNEETAAYASYVDGELNSYNARTLDTFDANYASRVPRILNSQAAVAAVLAALANGQQECFTRARADVAAFLDLVPDAFNELTAGAKSARAERQLAVVDFAFDLAGQILPAGNVKDFVGDVDSWRGIVGTFVPKEEPDAEKKVVLTGSTAMEMLSNLNTECTTLSDGIQAAEVAFYKTARRACDSMLSHESAYDIARPVEFLRERNRDNLVQGADIDLQLSHLVDIAARFDLIAAIQTQQAARLTSVAGTEAWTRPVWIGIGAVGFHAGYAELLNILEGVLTSSGKEMHDVAARLVLAANDFRDTDAAVKQQEDQLTALAREVRHTTRSTLEDAEVEG